MDFKEIVTERYNVKQYDGRKIGDKELRELFDIIRMAPSADNLQPWKIKVISDKDMLEKLLPATLSFNQEKVKTCSHLLVFCADTDLEAHWSRLEVAAKEANYSKSEIEHMAAVARMILGRSPEERLKRSQWDLFLAVGNAVNGARSLGLGASLMGGFKADDYARILELPGNLQPTLIVAIGYPADTPSPKLRFPAEEVFF